MTAVTILLVPDVVATNKSCSPHARAAAGRRKGCRNPFGSGRPTVFTLRASGHRVGLMALAHRIQTPTIRYMPGLRETRYSRNSLGLALTSWAIERPQETNNH